MARHFWFAFLIIVSLSAIVCPKSMGQYVYWADTRGGTINRARIDGTEMQTIAFLFNDEVRDMAFDLDRGKVYWVNGTRKRIERSNLNGTAREIVVSGLSNPFGIALDLQAGHIYWVTDSILPVKRSDLNGQNVETVISVGFFQPRRIAIDSEAGYLFIVSGINAGRIHRVSLDGTGLTQVYLGPGEISQLALDVPAGKIYWGETVTNVIKRANLDGSAVEIIIPPGLMTPLGLAIEQGSGKLYFGENPTDDGFMPVGRILRSNLDGTAMETIIPQGLFVPSTLALLADCVAAADGVPCQDGNPCTEDDYCQDGQCVGTFNTIACNDGNGCTTDDHCDQGSCIGVTTTASCNDRASCTLNDACADGLCMGEFASDDCFSMFLLITAVNGTACPSCPTAHLPQTEVRPGDIISAEVFLENWDSDSDSGLCENYAPCSVSAQDCAGKHCSAAIGVACTSDEECIGVGACVPNRCDSAPSVSTYQWTLDFVGLSRGITGNLNPLTFPCSSDLDCRHGIDLCTCADAQCVNGACNLSGTMLVDETREDFLFADAPYAVLFWGDTLITPFPGVGGVRLDARAVPDLGMPAYLGTMHFRVSDDARGTFIIDLDRNINFTFVLDFPGLIIPNLNILPATVALCDVIDSPNDCNGNGFPDECETDADGDGLIDDCDPCPVDVLNDSDGDGVCESQDGCPDDALKSAPGTCGCGLPDSGDADADGVLDCVDACPGVNDALYGPDCASAIPAVSSWGLVILALLMLTVAKLGPFARARDACHA